MGNKVLSYIHNGDDLSKEFINFLDPRLVRDIAAKAEGITFQKDLATLVIVNGLGWFKPDCTDSPLFPVEEMMYFERMKRLLKHSHQGVIERLFWDSEFCFPQELVQVKYSLENTSRNGDIRVSTDINIAGERFSFAMHVDAQVEEYNRAILYGLINWKFPDAVIQDTEINGEYFFYSNGKYYYMRLSFGLNGLISKIKIK
ncbi:TPA: hypothetical protein ACSTL0_000107 [Serratia fonticola]